VQSTPFETNHHHVWSEVSSTLGKKLEIQKCRQDNERNGLNTQDEKKTISETVVPVDVPQKAKVYGRNQQAPCGDKDVGNALLILTSPPFLLWIETSGSKTSTKSGFGQWARCCGSTGFCFGHPHSIMTKHWTEKTLRHLVSQWIPKGQNLPPVRIHTDTTDFFRVDYGDVLVMDQVPFLIRHNAKEGRVGLDDDVKFWVKRAIDLQTGDRKIIKMVSHEKFVAHVGQLAFECFRSPRKESRILDLVAGHNNFMHGYSVRDEKGNIIRVLEPVEGIPLSKFVEKTKGDHQTYFYSQLPSILQRFIEAVKAIGFLHEQG
jgi:hypothetical protein